MAYIAKKRKTKKTNPRNVPATMADLERAAKYAETNAIETCWAIFFTVLRDKHGWTVDQMRELWDEINYQSESIAEGYVTVSDMKYALREELGAVLASGSCVQKEVNPYAKET